MGFQPEPILLVEVELLSQSDVPIDHYVAVFAKHGIEAAYFVPTQTGLVKSIVDAHESLRKYLKSRSVHDFAEQGQGQQHKVSTRVNLVFADGIVERQLTLYRPKTKKGDPRLWVSRLGEYVRPFNLIALFVDEKGVIYIINCSRPEIWDSHQIAGSPLNRLLAKGEQSEVAAELLSKLTAISAMGFIDSKRDGPTGIGFTLETLLGIRANSSRAPDYKGIELKSGRMPTTGQARTRSTLFSQTPKWDLSNLKSGKEILDKFGYNNKQNNRKQLYCSVSSSPNSLGLLIRVDASGALIENLAVGPDESTEPVVVWILSELESALAAKHRETFWIKAQHRKSGTKEQFHFTHAVHTRRPLINNFGLLVDSGKIEIDYTLSAKPGGGSRDHGYLFKIWPKHFDLLFPPPKSYALSA